MINNQKEEIRAFLGLIAGLPQESDRKLLALLVEQLKSRQHALNETETKTVTRSSRDLDQWIAETEMFIVKIKSAPAELKLDWVLSMIAQQLESARREMARLPAAGQPQRTQCRSR